MVPPRGCVTAQRLNADDVYSAATAAAAAAAAIANIAAPTSTEGDEGGTSGCDGRATVAAVDVATGKGR